jgi:hypothetical protein
MDDWQPIANAPFGCDLQLSVVGDGGIHMLVFPCRRALYGWLDTKTGALVEIHPTHWRPWDDSAGPLARRK